MDYEKNLKYYHSKDTHFYIGFVILIIGGVVFGLGQFFHAFLFPAQTSIGLIVAIIGGLIAFVPRYLRSSGKDLDDAVESMTKDYATEAATSIGISHMLVKNPKPVYFGAYTYDGENVLIRRSKTDSKYRSNTYTVSAILFTRAGIFVSQKSVSLTEDAVKETVCDFVYGDLEKAEVVYTEHTFEDQYKKTIAHVVITANDGTKLMLPAEQNAALDRICDDINDEIKAAKA